MIYLINNINRIKRIPLRQVWKREVRDFTFWLQDNPDVLTEVVGIDLLNIEREQSAGNFQVDLLAEDSIGNTVIIENQLEKSDHDHLGKVITYLTAFEAKKAIWIVGEPRSEHVAAISWLNESTDCEFYLIMLEAIRIGDSDPAPLMTLIVGPSELTREASSAKKDKSIRHQKRYAFWSQLLEKSKKEHSLFNSYFDSHCNGKLSKLISQYYSIIFPHYNQILKCNRC